MRNDITIYCKNTDDLLETAKYIKDNYEFEEAIISKCVSRFRGYSKKLTSIEDVCIRLVVPSESLRALRGNVGLMTKPMEDRLLNNKEIYKFMINPSIGDFRRCIEKRELDRYLMAPISMLDKILREDISYILISDFRDRYDIDYVTNDVVSALSHLRKYDSNKIHICRQGDLNCEVDSFVVFNISDAIRRISELTI